MIVNDQHNGSSSSSSSLSLEHLSLEEQSPHASHCNYNITDPTTPTGMTSPLNNKNNYPNSSSTTSKDHHHHPLSIMMDKKGNNHLVVVEPIHDDTILDNNNNNNNNTPTASHYDAWKVCQTREKVKRYFDSSNLLPNHHHHHQNHSLGMKTVATNDHNEDKNTTTTITTTTNHNNNNQRYNNTVIPRFDIREFHLGRVLGTGGFGTVVEIQSMNILGSHRYGSTTTTTHHHHHHDCLNNHNNVDENKHHDIIHNTTCESILTVNRKEVEDDDDDEEDGGGGRKTNQPGAILLRSLSFLSSLRTRPSASSSIHDENDDDTASPKQVIITTTNSTDVLTIPAVLSDVPTTTTTTTTNNNNNNNNDEENDRGTPPKLFRSLSFVSSLRRPSQQRILSTTTTTTTTTTTMTKNTNSRDDESFDATARSSEFLTTTSRTDDNHDRSTTTTTTMVPRADSDNIIRSTSPTKRRRCQPFAHNFSFVAWRDSVTGEEGRDAVVLQGKEEDEEDDILYQGRSRTYYQDTASNDGVSAYVVKLISPSIVETDFRMFLQAAIDFARETYFLSVLEHPNILKLRAVGQEDMFSPNYFLLLDRLHETLSERIDGTWKKQQEHLENSIFHLNRAKKLEHLLDERIGVMKDLAGALCYMHDLKIVYRDLKPDNIGFDSTGNVKLFDFGLAREIRVNDECLTNGTYKLTPNTGSIRYIAPENANNWPYNSLTDCYSFGILLWEVLALERPYAHLINPKDIREMVIAWGERPKINESWSARMIALMKSAWDVHYKNRPTMKEIESELEMELMKS